MIERHCTRPYLADRIGDAAAIYVRSGSMHRFEHRRKLPFGVQVGRRCNADRAGARGPEVGQYVAEQIGANHNIESLGTLNVMRRQNVDVVLIHVNVGEILRHQCGT
jgi:hypothetical protein